jgi:hypothetical protein
MCRVVCKTYKTGFGLDDWIYCTLSIHNLGLQVIQCYHWSTYTLCSSPLHALWFSVFTSHILATDLLQITHEVFFAPPNSFLAISYQLLSSAISRTRPNSRPQLTKMNSSSPELYQLLTTTDCSFGTSRYIASGRTPRKTLSSIVPYCCRHVYLSAA